MADLEFGRYRVIGELGRGAMAVVYLAEDTMLERRVAVKALTEQYADDQNFRERFRREGRILARVQHDSIVPIFDSGEANGIPYLVMKVMPGGTLADRLVRAPLDPDRALGVLSRVASALDAAHAAGIIHRDLKPANVLFDERDLAYVADFGVGRLDGTASGVTQPGTVVGTAQYMSPEQVQGGAPTTAADIYSFGALAYETLVGEPPFLGADVWSVMRQHLESPPPRPSASRPWLAFADGPILSMLAKRPEERPRTATAAVEALRHAFMPGAARPAATPAPPRTGGSGTGTLPRAAPPAAAPPPQYRMSSAPPPTRLTNALPATPPPVVKPRGPAPAWRTPVLLAAIAGAIGAAIISVVLAQVLDDDNGSQQGGGDATSTPTRTPTQERRTPSPTPTETPSPTPTNTPRPPTQGRIIVNETFDGAAQSSVSTGTSDFGIVLIENGELVLFDTSDDGFLISRSWDTGRRDTSIEVRAFAAQGRVTLTCRDDDAYEVRAEIDSLGGRFRTMIYNGATSTFSTYVDWTETDLILKTEKSRLELICHDDRMELVINGTLVAGHPITGTTGTTVWVGASGGVGANVFVDDLIVRVRD